MINCCGSEPIAISSPAHGKALVRAAPQHASAWLPDRNAILATKMTPAQGTLIHRRPRQRVHCKSATSLMSSTALISRMASNPRGCAGCSKECRALYRRLPRLYGGIRERTDDLHHLQVVLNRFLLMNQVPPSSNPKQAHKSA